jgi:hypothetical protein
MLDFDTMVLAPTFSALGREATYAEPSGVPVHCRVMPRQGTVEAATLKFGQDIEIWRESLVFEVRAAEVSTPVAGGVLTVDGVAYTITGQPVRKDARRLVWTVDANFGVPVVYRSVTGTGAAQNPPQGSSFVVAAPALAGATSIIIKSVYAVGKLLPGDRVSVGGHDHVVTAPAQAVSNQITISISPALPADVGQGGPVVLSFKADYALRAAVSGYRAEEIIGGVQSGDLRVVVLRSLLTGAGLLDDPAPTGVLIAMGKTWAIKNVDPTYNGADVLAYEIQARRQ